MNGKEKIAAAIERILSELDGRAELLAATKTVPAELINFAISKGVRLIGENRVQELLEKYDAIDKKNAQFHFIGHLQTNKVKYIIDKVSMIESVDSIALAREIEKQAAKRDLSMRILVEINVGNEPGKSGIAPEETESFVDALAAFPHLIPCGVMAVPPKNCTEEEKKKNFQKISQKFLDIRAKKEDNKEWSIVSVGMSGDYLSAVENGSNLVRIGSAVFGERNYGGENNTK